MNEIPWEGAPTQMLADAGPRRGQRRPHGDMAHTAHTAHMGHVAHVAHVAHTARVARPVTTDEPRDHNVAHFSLSRGEVACPCVAQETAEVVARTGIEVLLDRLPDIELSVRPDRSLAGPRRSCAARPVSPHTTPTPAYGGRR